MQPPDTTRRRNRNDKRRSARIPIEDVTVEVYAETGEPCKPEVCDIVNLSEGGMLFNCSSSYDISQTVRLTFIIPNSMMTVRTDAVVVHGFVDLSGRYIGVRFSRLDPAEQACLHQFAQRYQNN